MLRVSMALAFSGLVFSAMPAAAADAAKTPTFTKDMEIILGMVDESKLFDDQPQFALLLSWHIADELMPKLTARGFRGDYIVPLPSPRIVKGK